MAQDGFGLFGKIPSKGDFVTENLPAEFIQPWDAWIKLTLRYGAKRMGVHWSTCFLSNPVWRFTLAPGVCGPRPWTGVIATSADGIGRPYPLTLAASPVPWTDPVVLMEHWLHGYERLTDFALEMMREGADFDHAVTRMRALSAALPFPAGEVRGRVAADVPLEPGMSTRVPLDAADSRYQLEAALARAGEAFSLMWLHGWGMAPFALVAAGLPEPALSLTLWETAGASV